MSDTNVWRQECDDATAPRYADLSNDLFAARARMRGR